MGANGRDPRRQPDHSLPIYTLIIPLYREWRVLPRLVAALRALDYPPAKLDVKLVVEAADRETRDALARLALPGFMEVVVAPPDPCPRRPATVRMSTPAATSSVAE